MPLFRKTLWPARPQRYVRWYASMGQMQSSNRGSQVNPDPYTPDTYTRPAGHTPQTAQPSSGEYVLTLKTDEALHKAVTALRNRYYPHLNKTSAHVALFRALPASELSTIQTTIEDVIHRHRPFLIRTGSLFGSHRGVGLKVRARPAEKIFRTLKWKWNRFLIDQDRTFQAHYSIQNKVEDLSVAKKAVEEIKGSFAQSTGMVTGLSLYQKDGAYWNLRQHYPFPEEKEQTKSSAKETTAEEEGPPLPVSEPAT
ncbi:MAG: hypothetical protein Q9225_007744 [Loekoesia sp. 1 TL-2023]